MYELRATVSAAQLLAKQGRRDEARAIHELILLDEVEKMGVGFVRVRSSLYLCNQALCPKPVC
jgi:hypothetical protein